MPMIRNKHEYDYGEYGLKKSRKEKVHESNVNNLN